MSLKGQRASKKSRQQARRRYAILHATGYHNETPTKPFHIPWKLLIVLGIVFSSIMLPSYIYFATVYLPSLPQPAQRDPFTLLWNGTTTPPQPTIIQSSSSDTADGNGGCNQNFPTADCSVTINAIKGAYIFATRAYSALTCTGSDSLGNSWTSFHFVVYAQVTVPGPDTVNVHCNDSNGVNAIAVEYNNVAAIGNTGYTTASNANQFTNTISLTTSNNAAIYEPYNLQNGANTNCAASVTAANGQTKTVARCDPNNANAFALYTDAFNKNVPTAGTNNYGVTGGLNGGANNVEHAVIELDGPSSKCPDGYNCLFSNVNSADNIQLNAKPKGPSTLDSFHTFNQMASLGNQTGGLFHAGGTFTLANSFQVASVTLMLNATVGNSFTGSMAVALYGVSGSPGTTGVPTGAVTPGFFPSGSPLAVSQIIQVSSLVTGSAVPVTFSLTGLPVLSAGSYTYVLTDNATLVPGVIPVNGNGQIMRAFENGMGVNPYAGHNLFSPAPHFDRVDWFTITGSASSSVALTNSPIDVSTSASKELLFYETWHNTTNIVGGYPWGWYLTTNATLPTQPNYTPLNDSSVVLANVVYPAGGASTVKNYYSYQSKTSGSQLLPLSGEGPDPYPTCPQTSTLYACDSQSASYGSSFSGISSTLNYTGNGGDNVTYSLFCVEGIPAAGSPNGNAYCSSRTETPTLSPCLGAFGQICATQVLPFLNINGGPFYLGFWSSVGQNGTITFGTSNTGNADVRANSVWYWVPNPTANTPAVTQPTSFLGFWSHVVGGAFNSVAGALSPITAPLANIGGAFLNVFVSGLIQAGNLLIGGLGVLAGLIVVTLNTIGNALGLGNIGTDISTLLTNFQIFFTNQLPTAFSNLGTLFSRWFDSLTILFAWVPIALSIAANLLTIGINGISFVLLIVQDLFLLWDTMIVVMLLLFWFADIGEYGLSGFHIWFETMKYLVFGLGMGPLLDAIHYGTDIILLMVGIIPKPIIQIAAKFDTIIPSIHISGSPTWPSFTMEEVRKGNYFSVGGFLIGVIVLVWFETTSLPGSITALVPGVGVSLTRLAGVPNLLLIFLEIFGFMALFILPAQLFQSMGLGLSTASLGNLQFRRGPSVSVGSVGVAVGRREPGRILQRAEKKLGKGPGNVSEKKMAELTKQLGSENIN